MMGSPPCDGLKTLVPNARSKSSRIKAPVSDGKLINCSSWALSTDHTKIGIRKKVIPGARNQTIVVTKFTAPMTEEIPNKIRLIIHTSCPEGACKLTGGYDHQPA